MRVVLTRRAGENDRLARRLREEGFDVAEVPLIRVDPLPGPPLRPDGYDWVVLTSRAGVAELFRRLDGSLPPVAAIGPGTAAALRERGVEPAVVASDSTQEGLVRELPRPPGRVLFAGAEGARDVLVRELGADFVPLYRTVLLRPDPFPRADLVVLASGSAARALAAAAPGQACVSLGPVTSRAARERGLPVLAEAETADMEGLVRAVKLAASRAASSPS
jgi:uroporphyrinogen III methyltransferase / synthase